MTLDLYKAKLTFGEMWYDEESKNLQRSSEQIKYNVDDSIFMIFKAKFQWISYTCNELRKILFDKIVFFKSN